MTTTITTAEITGDQTIQSNDWAYLGDLSLSVPPDPDGNHAITLTLNVPDGYAQGNNYPGTQCQVPSRQW